ncbi:MAG TPA: hypothetical protein PK079_20155 [Leptospiraceae bacterium]|nr:hypothetical protein [Leptospiraceae bacterium]HMW07065.1 hypothetical protein [Leptospiraceae bacterium]HMX35573.1 hypothetical protein [Leptospiraceae bacterium]HMY33738.1 hypothetical protein [Leptospiraceae bacterium]HMZ66230.1 hypothetical protein [Leptospiraceae bacterium]
MSSYNHFIFSNLDANQLLDRIYNSIQNTFSKRNKKPNIHLENSKIEIQYSDYLFTFLLIDEDWVLEESKDIAERFAKTEIQKEVIYHSKKRVEFWGNDDYQMNYFNDYLILLENIQKDSDVIIFDTINGKFFDEIGL